jgi:hypothetical protein
MHRQNLPPIVIAGVAFIVDLYTPNGLLDGILYVFAVLACRRIPKVNASLYAACGVTLLTVLGFALSPMGVSVWMAVANQFTAIVIIWATAAVVRHSAQVEIHNEFVLAEITERMCTAERSAHDVRIGMSKWLREEVGLELDMIDWRLNRFSRYSQRSFDLQTETLMLRRAIQRTRRSVSGRERGLREIRHRTI